MMLSAPKLRDDVAICRQETSAGAFFIIKDPITGDFFRVREPEQYIARQLDGETPIDVVRQRVEQRFDAALSPNSLNDFIKTLGSIGLLETGETGERRVPGRPRRSSGTLLYLRWRLFDPHRLFSYLEPRLRWMFTPLSLLVSAAVIMMAVATMVGSWDEYVEGLRQLYQLATIPLLVVLSFLLVSLHECGHGLTCRHFGGEVHEVGFLLIYFQPALYCNVSDAWLFPERSKRMWVGFAGPYFELFLWAIAVTTWRIADPETWISTSALIVMTTSGIKTLFNFNPLLKLDGYYLLSDYLELPNLRSKAFRHIGDSLKRFVGVATVEKEIPARERRIYTIYGLVATVTSFSALGYIILSGGGTLLAKGGPELILLSTVLVAVRFRRRFQRMFGRHSLASDSTDDGDVLLATGTPPPSQTAGPRRTKRRNARRWFIRAVMIVVLAGVVCFCWLGHTELRISGPFTILPKDNTNVRAAVEGIIDSILVAEGDRVRAGESIARLSDKELRSELGKTEAQIRETAARIRLLEAGPTDKEIDLAKAAVTKAEDRLKYAEGRYERAKLLFEERLRPRNEYEDTKELVTLARNELTEAIGRLQVLLSGRRPEEIEAAKAEMERLETQKRYVEQQLRLLNVVSPASGIVATPTRQLLEMRQALVRRGDLILRIYDAKTVTAQILISEREIDGVQIGQPVAVRPRAYPEREFRGRVTSIATSAQAPLGSTGPSSLLPTSTSSAVNRTIVVDTEIENASLLLKSEMTGQAKIYCGQRRVVDLIMRRLARTVKVEFWSWW
ncbi:MAG TPA: efflux RND transporter periplasmic adaptor subunit [Bryobacteraceae bacterium]|nr:efflux RND transporter periplasmic adaptor subunit [Bryobacteraceae bacterium]